MAIALPAIQNTVAGCIMSMSNSTNLHQIIQTILSLIDVKMMIQKICTINWKLFPKYQRYIRQQVMTIICFQSSLINKELMCGK